MSKNNLQTNLGHPSVLADFDAAKARLNPGVDMYLQAATSDNTRKAYQQDIRHFMAGGGLLPANTTILLNYLHQHVGVLKPQTLKRRLTAIKHWHVYQGFADPTSHPLVRKALAGIARLHGVPVTKAAALSLEQLSTIMDVLSETNLLMNCRDRALILAGFFGALRRSELVAITWEDIHFVEEGVTIQIKRSKTDQTGIGQTCAIPIAQTKLCAMRALKEWQVLSQQNTGPVFRAINKHQQIQQSALTPLSVSHILKKVAHSAKLPNPENYSGHSLRRGFATAASKKGVPIVAIMRQGRWRHEGTVYGYIEEGKQFQDNAASLLLQGLNCYRL